MVILFSILFIVLAAYMIIHFEVIKSNQRAILKRLDSENIRSPKKADSRPDYELIRKNYLILQRRALELELKVAEYEERYEDAITYKTMLDNLPEV